MIYIYIYIYTHIAILLYNKGAIANIELNAGFHIALQTPRKPQDAAVILKLKDRK